MSLLWLQHYQEEDCRFLLVKTYNTFNEENQTAMLWAIRFEWPGGAVYFQLLLPLGQSDGAHCGWVRSILAQKVRHNKGRYFGHDFIWHRSPPAHL